MARMRSQFELSVRLYARRASGWKAQHIEAQACFDLEEHLALGVSLFDLLRDGEDTWHRRVLEGKIAYNPRHHEGWRRVIGLWAQPCEGLERAVGAFEKRGFAVEGAEEFRRRCDEARWRLADPGELFNHPEFDVLRDAALADHRAGHTSEA